MNKIHLPGGYFRYKQTIFEELETFGIVVPNSLQHKKNYCFFDIEAILEKVQVHHGEKVTLTHRHRVISAAFASTLPGMAEAQCVVNEDPNQIVKEMFTFFHTARQEAIRMDMVDYIPYIKKLQRKFNIERQKAIHKINAREDSEEGNPLSDEQEAKKIISDPLVKQYADLLERFYSYISIMPIFTFNGARSALFSLIVHTYTFFLFLTMPYFFLLIH